MKVIGTSQFAIVAFFAMGLAVGVSDYGVAQSQAGMPFADRGQESTQLRLGPDASGTEYALLGKPGLPQIDITGYFAHGSHCQLEGKGSNAKLNATSTYLGGPRDNFELMFDKFILQSGHYGNPKNSSSLYGDCLVELDIDIPKGYRISYLSYDIYGGLGLGRGKKELIKRRDERAEVQTTLRLETRDPAPELIAGSTHSLSWSEDVLEDFRLTTAVHSYWQGCTTKARLVLITTTSLSSRSSLRPDSWISVDSSDGKTGESIYVHLSPCSQ